MNRVVFNLRRFPWNLLYSRSHLAVLLANIFLLFCCPNTKLNAAPFRTLEGRYVKIITDLPDTPASREWTQAFDAAVPKFCEFWQVPLENVDGWRATACMMSSKEPFIQRGLLPTNVPDFPHGFQIGSDIWVLDQPSEYYLRHLLVHEAAHAFAFHVFGGAGPAWFMEGTAEYLATHRWDGTTIELGVVPDSSAAFPYWGRFKMIDARRANQQALSLISILRYSETAHRQVEPYAWTWAAIHLFASDPETRKVLIDAARHGSDASPDFTRQFVADLGSNWPLAQLRWQLMINEFDYGYDMLRNGLEITEPAKTWDGSPDLFEVQADRGWQFTGLAIEAGTEVQLSAEGNVTLANQPKPWVSSPSGVTVRYYQGRPLGTLLACIASPQPEPAKLVQPLEIVELAPTAKWTAKQSGWLLLKVGDDPSELEDNAGKLLVRLQATD